MKLNKKLIFSIIGTIVIITIIVIYNKSKDNDNEKYLYETAKISNIEQTVSATGTVTANSDIKLSFEVNGKIKNIPFKVNDKVTKGDILTELENTNLQIKVSEAQAKLNAEQARLNKILSGATSEQIEISKEKINSSKISHQKSVLSYENLQQQLETTLEKYQLDIKTAQNSLENSEIKKQALINAQKNEIELLKETALNICDNIYYSTNNIINSIQSILDDDKFDDVTLGITSIKNKDEMLNNLQLAKEQNSNLKDVLAVTTNFNSISEIISITDTADLLLEKLNNVLLNLTIVLSNTILTPSLTQADVNTFKTTTSTLQTTNGSLKSSNKTAKYNLVNKDESYKQSLVTVNTEIINNTNTLRLKEKLLKQERENQTKQLDDAKSAISTALSNISLAEKQFNELTAKAQSYDIMLQKSSVDQAKSSLDYAYHNLGLSTLKAPIDGIITKINFDIGEQINTTTPVIYMESLNDFQVEVDVAESDISKLYIGDKAEIMFDAYSDEIKELSQISEIEPSETLIQDIIYYKVVLPLKTHPEGIKSGLSTDVTFFTEQKNDVITIPQRAVITNENNIKITRILLDDNQIEEREIVTGIKGDNGMVEIKKGLKEGDKVVTLIKNNND